MAPSIGHAFLAATLLVLLAHAAAAARPEPELVLPSDARSSAALGDERPVLQQSIADRVNRDGQATWKATARNPRLQGLTVKDVKRLCGALKSPSPDAELPVVSRRTVSKGVELPASFDAREAWPRCKSIGTVLDQGHCGSCWAFGAVEALSDRFCIQGFENVTLSENDLLACCGFDCGYGCEGGYPYRAWQYFQRKGVVSNACFPYFDATGCAHPGCEPVFPTPTCSRSCVTSDDLWAESKHFATTAYYVASGQEELKLELFTNGPFEVSFDVYEDFAHYESGVYQYTTGEYLGGHAVKFIGWGTTDDGVDYWTVVNSWNTGWGDNGLFKILRGTNDCDIETGATAGLPYLRGGKRSDM